jgi:hypothetical protein
VDDRVVVQQGDEFGGGRLDALVARGGKTCIGMVLQDAHRRVVRRDEGHRAVLRTVVYDNDLEVRVLLACQGEETRGQLGHSVPVDDDDGHAAGVRRRGGHDLARHGQRTAWAM